MSIIRVDNIKSKSDEVILPVNELRSRVIKTYRNSYSGGSWDPSDTYSWLPAGFVDYTPVSSTSRIRFNINISFAHTSGHGIAHCIFYANNVEIGRHSIAGQSPEHRHMYVWDFASWGTTESRIGYQVRRYGGSNIPRFHGTFYWNGTGSNQAAQTEILLEEYFPIS
jgi:hypothetical protein